MPNFTKIKETFCGGMDGRTHVCTDGRTFETGFIRSTLSKSRPNNTAQSKNQTLVAATELIILRCSNVPY